MTYNTGMSLRITHVAASLPPRLGGVETHLAQISKLQQEAGHQVTLLTIDDKQLQKNKAAVWSQILKQRHKLLRADVVHVHDVFWWILPLLPILKLHSIKVVTTFHGWEGDFPIRWQAKLQRRIYNWLSDISVHVGGWIQELYGDVPDLVIYGGVASPLTQTSKKREQKVAFFGRLEPENSIQKYAQLFKHLQSNHISDLVWIGDGSMRDECEQIAPVTGMVSAEKRDQLLKNTVFVCANSYLSMLEAQAAGCIVVALYDHYLKQRYLETYPGFETIVSDVDPQRAAEKIIRLLQNKKELERLRSKSTAFAASMTWEKIATAYEECYQN